MHAFGTVIQRMTITSDIYRILEEMAGTVFADHMNEHVLLKLLSDLHATLDDRAVWGTHLGSETLMRGHKNARSRIACIAALEKRKNELELQAKQKEASTGMEELPEECVREILCRLSDYKDVDSAGDNIQMHEFQWAYESIRYKS